MGSGMLSERERNMAKPLFLCGLFLICMCGLMLQVLETRILSVITYYHMAFFAISLAMFGMTAGSLFVYFRPNLFAPERLFDNLAWTCAAFGLAVTLSALLVISSVVFVNFSSLVMMVFLWLKLILVLVPPYFVAGMAISLALTRSPWPVGLVYGVDLAGAATGCLAILVLIERVDAISAMFAIGAIGALAASCFAIAGRESGGPRDKTGPLHLLARRPLGLAAALAALAAMNAVIHPHGLTLAVAHNALEMIAPDDVVRWNSFSRITAKEPATEKPWMWGPSAAMPPARIEQRVMKIDGGAGTPMYRFDGDLEKLDYLKYDITNLAYYLRNEGRAAVIGVGGGRDVLSAYVFGFRDVTGVELNRIFIDFLTRDFRDFSQVGLLPGLRLVVDEARNWFARTHDQFDLIQMSLIDTWAATGAGAFSLSENGLYTVQGWRKFLATLKPDGVFTVSRWYAPDNIDETGRLMSLAAASLLDMGVAEPRQHLALVAWGELATLIVRRTPLTTADVETLTAAADKLGFSVVVRPDAPAASPLLERILGARDRDALRQLSRGYHLDLSPPTDDRPFFFNQLLIGDPASMLRAANAASGVMRGNLLAIMTLAIIVTLSAALVLATMIIPALSSVRRTQGMLAWCGTLYFLLIGLGFMLVEIGLIQRLSIFLGHPVYGLAIGLFGIILSTGTGSLVSARLPLNRGARLLLWSGALGTYLLLLPVWFPGLVAAFEAAALPMRALTALVAVVPAGMLMGFAFPTGMQMVNAIDMRPTPWFWAVNGAAGVLGTSIAVAVGIQFSIDASLRLGAACYFLLAPVALGLAQSSGTSNRAA
jgi:hypothetical protein